MNSPALNRSHTDADPASPPVPADNAGAACLPPGPLTTAELAAAVPDPRHRALYQRIWHGMYRREDQPNDLRLRSVALARTWPEGVLRGRSAALLWGDDSVPANALPEIWLPATRRSRDGRVYRYGAMPAVAVTELDGMRVTTPLRTCRDLASDLDFEDAVVSVERLCAMVAELPGQLRGAVEHPSGRGSRRFADVVAAIDPRSGSAESTRARLHLAAAGFRGFAEGHQIRVDGRPVTLPLADPVTRCVVITSGGPAGPLNGASADVYRTKLRQAGWTILVVRGPEVVGSGAVGATPLEVLSSRWPGTDLLPPRTGAPAADPLGMWAGRQW